MLAALVLAIANFSDVQKVKAAATFTSDATSCTITTSYTPPAPYAFPAATCEGKNVTITGNGAGSLIIVMSGTHTFKNLTVANGAELTQDSLIAGTDFADDTTSGLTTSGLNKKVDLNITEKLTLTNQGRIDVSGKGFPGGVEPHKNGPTGDGYGPGGGCSRDGDKNYSGGGHGGTATSTECSGGGAVYGNPNAPEENGSGGGYRDKAYNNGFAGGGRIKIFTHDMNFDQNDQTFIAANGDGSSTFSEISGGGAGGSVWLKVTGQLTSSSPSPGSPSALGESSDNNYIGQNGSVIGGQATFGKYIVANGGKNGGAGGRILIDVPNPITVNDCDITSGDIIPAVCEGRDVTVSNSTTRINMNKVQVKPNGSSWVDCTGDADKTTNSICDSQRHFTNLTVENGAVLTHEAITRADLKPDGKSIDRNTGTARWKKVDLVVSGNITLRSSGIIDASGKGYPGGQFIAIGGTTPVYGCNGVATPYNGSGPGGGLVLDGDGHDYDQPNFGAGGGYGGSGGKGDSPEIPFGGIIYLEGGPYPKLEYGSGGGDAYSSHYHGGLQNRHDCSHSVGGSGGGLIMLKVTGAINIDNSSRIVANGNESYMVSENTSTAEGGSGSGGTIYIVAAHLTTVAGSAISALGGPGGTAFNVSAFANTFNIFANGGSNVGGGGGGRIITGVSTPSPIIQSKKIEVTVTWTEGSQNKTIKLYDVLRSVVN